MDSELTVLYIHHAHIKESLFPTLELKAQDLCRDLKFLLAFYLYTIIEGLNQYLLLTINVITYNPS